MKRFSYKPDLTADPSKNTSVTECLIENVIQRTSTITQSKKTYSQLVLFNPNHANCADVSSERNGKTKSGQCHARYTRERWCQTRMLSIDSPAFKSECHQKDPSLRRPGATNSVLSWLIISPGFHNIPA